MTIHSESALIRRSGARPCSPLSVLKLIRTENFSSICDSLVKVLAIVCVRIDTANGKRFGQVFDRPAKGKKLVITPQPPVVELRVSNQPVARLSAFKCEEPRDI